MPPHIQSAGGYNELLQSATAVDTMDAMKAKRHVVMVGVKNYPAIARLDEERLQKMSQAKSE